MKVKVLKLGSCAREVDADSNSTVQEALAHIPHISATISLELLGGDQRPER